MLSASGADHRGAVGAGQVGFQGFFAPSDPWLVAGPPAGTALLTAALLAIPVPLFAFALLPGFLVGGRDRVETGPDNRARHTGCAADDGNAGTGNGSDQTSLEHQGCSEQDGEGGGPDKRLGHCDDSGQ